MKVIISGGGIGGLALALALDQRGIRSEIYERTPEIRELGVGINVLPHAIEHLASWGLLEALDAAGLRTRQLIYKTARGQEILRQPRGQEAGLDWPQFSIHRGMLQGLLATAVRARLGDDAIRTSRRITGFHQDEVSVTALMESSSGTREATGDVLIGCDGIHSALRPQISGAEGEPRWNGVIMWRGATWAAPFLDGRSMIIAGGMKAKLVLYPIHVSPDRPGEVLTNWVVCAKLDEDGAPLPIGLEQDWSVPAHVDDLIPYLDGVLQVDEIDVNALVRGTERILLYPMCDRDPLERWSLGRVSLLGDAAHPMYPVGSNGSSQAVLDAVCLADRLASAEGAADPAAALAAYEAERRPQTAEIVAANRCGGPERVIDLVEERAPEGFDDLDRVASHDELTAIVGQYHRLTSRPAAAGI